MLASLKSSGAITEASYARYAGAYVAAQSSLHKLSGTRRAELQSVMANTQQMAAANELTPSRLPVVMLTLERNRQWWTTEPLIASRERVSFPGSKIVWEYYAGQGIQIQWLGTFGEANGYYLSGHENESLRQLLGEVLPLATDRAGGIAWEYMFHFDGGAPPWTSGLSQGTALQVLARAWSRFKEQAYLTAAQQALGIFETPPPAGVQVKTPAGAEYAEYSYAPSDRILNGFIQADVGLYDYTSITHDPLGLRLFEEGDAQARAQTPGYDTGGWSMYDQHGESDLSYHELLTEFSATPVRTHAQGPADDSRDPGPGPLPHAVACGPGAIRAVDRRLIERRRLQCGGRERGLGACGLGACGLGDRGDDGGRARPGTARGERQKRADVADRGGRNLLHDGGEIHRRPEHAAGRLAAQHHAADERAGGRAGVAVEDLNRADQRQTGRNDRVEQRRDGRTRQAEAAVDDAVAGGHILGHGHRDRPVRELCHRNGDDHPRQGRQGALTAGTAPRLEAMAHTTTSEHESEPA